MSIVVRLVPRKGVYLHLRLHERPKKKNGLARS